MEDKSELKWASCEPASVDCYLIKKFEGQLTVLFKLDRSSIMEWPIYFLAYLLPEFSFTAVRDMDGRKPVGLGYCRLV